MDDDRRVEQSKVAVRWLVLAVLLAAVFYLRRADAVGIPWPVILGLTTGAAGANVAFTAILRRAAPRWLRYVTTATDLSIISLLVAYSGGSASPFYYIYFIVLVSNSIRYGMAMALFVALLFNVAYVAVLLVHPVGGDLTIEGVKILTFWGVALYAGYLAARSQRQARILQAYEETIAGLKARVDELERPHHTEPPV
jgi:K+-sensing histidine kinase KdpD